MADSSAPIFTPHSRLHVFSVLSHRYPICTLYIFSYHRSLVVNVIHEIYILTHVLALQPNIALTCSSILSNGCRFILPFLAQAPRRLDCCAR